MFLILVNLAQGSFVSTYRATKNPPMLSTSWRVFLLFTLGSVWRVGFPNPYSKNLLRKSPEPSRVGDATRGENPFKPAPRRDCVSALAGFLFRLRTRQPFGDCVEVSNLLRIKESRFGNANFFNYFSSFLLYRWLRNLY